MDTIIYDSADMPKRLFRGESTMLNRRMSQTGAIMVAQQRQLAMQISQKIVEDRAFFLIEETDHGRYIRTRTSAVVMTVEEWRSAMEEQFKRGMEAATRMMTPFEYPRSDDKNPV